MVHHDDANIVAPLVLTPTLISHVILTKRQGDADIHYIPYVTSRLFIDSKDESLSYFPRLFGIKMRNFLNCFIYI